MLYLLQSFDTVCKKHDIDYWLDYGTLLELSGIRGLFLGIQIRMWGC